jgi:hypothetical protein
MTNEQIRAFLESALNETANIDESNRRTGQLPPVDGRALAGQIRSLLAMLKDSK